MKTHQQLGVMISALEDAGWVRLNGNTWEDPTHQWRVQTAYAHREATVRLLHPTVYGEKVWVCTGSDRYRGSEPLKWFMGYAGLLPTDKVSETCLLK